MREPLTLEQVKVLLDTPPKVEPGMADMLGADVVDYIQAAPDVRRVMLKLEETVAAKDKLFGEFNLALVEYANETGGGQMLLDNFRLCLDQVRMRQQGQG
jgi:antitoxin component HigA of HigAB toxin-antitoxin module